MSIKRGTVLLIFLAVSSAVGVSSGAAKRRQQATDVDVNNLYSANDDVRSLAADRLAALGPSVIPTLIPVICNKSRANFDRAWPAAAKALGELKASAAAPCLVMLLAWNFPPIGPAYMKSDETISAVDPAFAALVKIGGEPVVHALRYEVKFLQPEGAYLGLRILRIINTPSAKEAVGYYIKSLNDQLRLANTVLDIWDK
jgi:hypothetical protein